MSRRYLALLLVVFLAFSFIMPSIVNDTADVSDVVRKKPVYRTAYTLHAPINISSNADFALQGWPGNGSEANPYRIQNLNISTEMLACVWVMNTTSHFVIEDCLFVSEVYNYTDDYYIFPVTLANVSNGRVEHNNFTDCYAAISVYQATNCSISNNNLNASFRGISAVSCNSTTISGNTQGNDACAYGLGVYYCRNCTVSMNVFDNITSSGISATLLYDVHFIQNTFHAFTGELAFTWEGLEIGYAEDCRIERNVISGFQYSGMRISGSDFTVANNNITSSSTGMVLFTNNSTVTENRINVSYRAIEMVQANGTEVHHNMIYGRNRFSDSGINIYGGFDSDVHSNDIRHASAGIYLQGATRFNVSSNNVTEGRYGIIMGWWTNWGEPEKPLSDCDIINNRFDGGGFYPMIESYESWDFSTIRFEDNTVNGEPIGFFAHQNGGDILGESYGQLFLVDCQDVTITGGTFHGISSVIDYPYADTGIASALTLLGCTSCTITDASFLFNTIGVTMYDCIDCEFAHMEGVHNAWAAVEVHDSEEIVFTDASISSNTRGISLIWSYNCRIIGCEIEGNDEGIWLQAAMNCTLCGNIIVDNGDAIFLEDSDGSEMRNNTISLNDRGILLNSTSDCLITQNMVANNTGVGISLDISANRNSIYNNTFAYNTPNAICRGSSNHWDNEIDLGNYWSDYSGNGTYIIDDNDQDHYPRMYPYTAPTTTTDGLWLPDPLILAATGGVVGVIAIVIVLHRRRQIRIVE